MTLINEKERTTIFPDIGNWRAIRATDGFKMTGITQQAFWIHDAEYRYVAFLSSGGSLNFRSKHKIGVSDSITLEFSGEVFSSKDYGQSYLKKAVQYAYLKLQEKEIQEQKDDVKSSLPQKFSTQNETTKKK